MPIAQITTLAGIDDDRRRAVIETVTKALATSLDVQPAAVRVLITEVPPTAWGVGGQPLADR